MPLEGAGVLVACFPVVVGLVCVVPLAPVAAVAPVGTLALVL